jgi:hypothetical protein
MTIRITATIVRGQGNAATNHRALIPRIATRFPEVAKCGAHGTINVALDQPLDRRRTDFWTPQIAWIPVAMPGAERVHRLEAFGFIRIGFECPLGGAPYNGWIILPEGSELTYRENRAEIIVGVFVAGVEYGARCAIHIDHIPAIAAPPWFGEMYGRSLQTKNDSASEQQA